MELHRESRIFGGGNAVIDLVLERGVVYCATFKEEERQPPQCMEIVRFLRAYVDACLDGLEAGRS